MASNPSHFSRRLAATAAAAACLTAAGLAGCGDDGAAPTPESPSPAATSPDAPVASPPMDGAPPDATIPDLPVNDDPEAVTCTGPPQGVFDATTIVGMSEADAATAAEAEGCAVRVVEIDGRGLAVTDDFRPDRINVAVADGVVEKILSLG